MPQNLPLDTTVRYCLYARKSSESEERQALSIDSQINEMNKLIERENLLIAATKSESHSAKQSGQREVFNQMIKDINHGKYNAILTWAPDRLSRNAGDLGQLVDLMDKGLLVSIKTFNQTFTNSPNDKFLLMILCSQAKLENDNRSINVKRGMRARVEMGLRPGLAPLGYINSNNKDELCVVYPDPERAAVVRQMFEKVGQEEWSGYQVLHWLKDIGFKSRGGKYLVIARIYDILRSPFYCGRFEYPKGSGRWYQGKHKPLISQELFDRVQRQLSLRSYQRKSSVKGYAFLRLMRCGHCGSGITAEEKFKFLKNGDKTRYVYYMCTRGKNRRCPALYINEKDLLSQLDKIIDEVDIDLIGMREKMDRDIFRYHDIRRVIFGIPFPEQTSEVKEFHIRAYAKMILKEGGFDERREILQNLKSKLIIKDKKMYLDKS